MKEEAEKKKAKASAASKTAKVAVKPIAAKAVTASKAK